MAVIDNEEAPVRSDEGNRLRSGRTLLLVATAALIVGGSGLGLALSDAGASPVAAVTCSSSTPKLTVQGTGRATGAPDLLTAVFGLSTNAPTAAAALTSNDTKVSQALLALAANGVARKDVQTTDLTLSPNYAYPHGVPTISGYQVQNTVTASLHNLKNAGSAIDALVSATGNAAQIQSLSFSFDKPAVVEGKARAAAVRQAVRDAAVMATAAGRRLGPVCSLTDNTQPTVFSPDQTYANAGAATSLSPVAAASVPLESGTQTETDQVTMVYAVQTR